MDYRRDVDGLRAIAVLAVIFFHFGFSFLPGGFIGVDIFFVISGYLITSIILDNLNRDVFSFKDFYLRRARRILPALYVVLIASFICAMVMFLPKDHVAFGKSLISTVLFGSNVFFMQETGYFDSSALSKPLLHTWSLAVEEQFYFVFPLFMVLLRKYIPRHFFTVIFFLLAANLALSEVARQMGQTKAFFLSPARAWEFMMGALLTYPKIRAWGAAVHRQLAAIVGFAFIAVSAVAYTDLTPFPGLGALLPCLGTVLIIFAGVGHSTALGKILSSGPFVYVGLRSYSLYLWHWPVLVFATYARPAPLTLLESFFFIAVAFVLSVVTYRYVEYPCRKKIVFSDNRVFVWGLIALSVFLLGVGVTSILAKGLPQRFQGIEILEQQKITKFGDCADLALEDFPSKKCSLGKEGKVSNFIVWGDSHAYALAPAIDLAAKQCGSAGFLSSNSGCPPLLNAPGLEAKCLAYNGYIEENIKPDMVVFLSARWNYYVKKSAINYEGKPSLVESSVEGSLDVLRAALLETVSVVESKGAQAVIIRPEVEFYKDVPELYFLAGHESSVPRIVVENNNAAVNGIIDDVVEESGAKALDTIGALCDENECTAFENGAVLFIDNDHLSERGAAKLAPIFEKILN